MDAQTTQKSNAAPDFKLRVANLYAFIAKRLGIQQAPKITLSQDVENAKKEFGLTAYYNQQEKSVRLYMTDRHPTDILRSFAHELIHHWQNEHGALPSEIKGGHAHYAQNDPVLRKREMEAYLLGNILFRDWQDENRYGPINENLQITNGKDLKQTIKQMLFDLVKRRTLSSYHRDRTSGDMDPGDFIEELARNLELKVTDFLDLVNNRGNQENQPNMIKEMISRRELKALVKERVAAAMEGRRHPPKDDWDAWDQASPHKKEKEKIMKGKKAALIKSKGGPQNYAQWLKSFLAQTHSKNERGAKYYQIGFGHQHTYYTWYWDPTHKQIVWAKGGSHKENFGNDIPYKTFRGRYDINTQEVSLTVPEHGAQKMTGKLEKDVPMELRKELKRVFHDPKIFYFPFIV